jgi:hypothetical protein
MTPADGDFTQLPPVWRRLQKWSAFFLRRRSYRIHARKILVLEVDGS